MGGRGASSGGGATIKNSLGKEVPFMTTVPKGWKEDMYATTAPKGYVWINNGESHFSKDYKSAIVPENAWDYREFVERREQLEKGYKLAKSGNKVGSIYSSLKKLDKALSDELSGTKNQSEQKTLSTERRKVRQLIKKIIAEEKM